MVWLLLTQVQSQLLRKLKQLIVVRLVISVHGQDGLVAVLHVVVVKLIAAEFTAVLANGKNKQ